MSATTETATTETATTENPRQLGRPRDPKLDTAIIGATLQLLADGGYAALTMEAVAAMAGVGKATLYRRWAGKEQLVIEAVATLSQQHNSEQVSEQLTGVRDELVARLEAMRRKSDSSLAGKIFPRLIGEAEDNPEFMARYREQVLEPRRQRFRACLARGIEQGLIRPDVDLDHAIDLMVGPMVYRSLIRRQPPPGPELAARIVDDVLVCLAPRPAPQETA